MPDIKIVPHLLRAVHRRNLKGVHTSGLRCSPAMKKRLEVEWYKAFAVHPAHDELFTHFNFVIDDELENDIYLLPLSELTIHTLIVGG